MTRNPIPEESILDLEPVYKVNIMGYVPKEREGEKLYLKIRTATPNVISPLRSIFER